MKLQYTAVLNHVWPVGTYTTAPLPGTRQHTVSRLWEMTEQMNILYPKNWTKDAAEEILNFQDLLCRKLALEIMARCGKTEFMNHN